MSSENSETIGHYLLGTKFLLLLIQISAFQKRQSAKAPSAKFVSGDISSPVRK